MPKSAMLKISVCVPKTHVDATLEAMHKHGCGSFGNGKYEGNAFLTFGHGTWIAMKGSKPSMTSIKAKASNRVFNIARRGQRHLPLPLLFRYLKNSELGSSTIRSLLFLKLPR